VLCKGGERQQEPCQGRSRIVIRAISAAAHISAASCPPPDSRA
jgi:hypothetical protein